MADQIIIFDTTLRDGEQSPGAALNVMEKLEIARQLQKLNIDVMEAGFPVSSPAQFEAVKRISGEINDVIVCALSRAKELDIKKAWQAIQQAVKPRIHTFSSTSDYHIMGKFGGNHYGLTLQEKRKTVLKMSYDSVAYAKTFCEDVEFSAEDAGRTEISYLADVIETAIDAGATTVNIPDTTGYNLPREYAGIIAELKKRVKNINKAIISVHCHNDLGLAVANSLAALDEGARQIECTINGIGERAGNASLEEIVMALKTRQDLLNYKTCIKTREIYNTSRMVSGFTGMIVQPNKAIVGANAFAHESGIHQDGMLKNRETYEIMVPEDVGVVKTNLVLGRHSGRHGLKSRLEELGYTLEETGLDKIYARFIEISDKKKEIFDDDLRILMGDETFKEDNHYKLEFFQVYLGSHAIPTAAIKLRVGEEILQESATGDGPVAAVFNAIERVLKQQFIIENYQVRSVTAGREALGEAQLRLKVGDDYFNGRGVSTDIIEASAKAFLVAINQMKKKKSKKLNKE